MKVNPSKPHRIIYAIQQHPQLGALMEPYAVQLNDQGKLTFTNQRIYVSTADAFKHRMDDTDHKLIELLDSISSTQIARKYKKGKNTTILDFFNTQLDKEKDLLRARIRPMIDQQLSEAFQLCRDRRLFETDRNGNPTLTEIEYEPSPVSVVFHIKRNNAGTMYFPKLRHEGKPLHFMKKGAIIVCENPCWLLLDHHLYHFSREFPGNKLKPFLNKESVHIPPAHEEAYYQKFVKPLVESYDVKAEGVEMIRQEAPLETVLRLEEDLDMMPLLVAEHRAGGRVYRHGELPPSWVEFDKPNDDFRFIQYWVVPRWEDRMSRTLQHLGLIPEENGVFRLKTQNATIDDYLQWLGKNEEVLQQHNIIFGKSHSGQKCYHTGKLRFEIGYEMEGDWFELFGKVYFGEHSFSLFQLRRFILEGKREIPLPDGTLGRLPDEWFSRWEMLFLMAKTDGQDLRLSRNHFSLLQEVEDLDKKEKRLRFGHMHKITAPSENAVKVDPSVRAKLRPYQTLGFNWLYALYEEGFGGCLADDMGLGKTLQTLAFIQTVRKNSKAETTTAPPQPTTAAFANATSPKQEQGWLESLFEEPERRSPSLVVMPTSLIYNWQAEAARFCPELRVLVYQGTQRHHKLRQLSYFDLVLTTYGSIRNDIEALSGYAFEGVILDESQAIKNPESKISRAVRQLQARYKLVLTGTPIENSLTDLWAQMAFVNPGLLGSLTNFKKQFATPIEKSADERRRERLQKLVQPFILRRTKEEVASDLPELSTQVYYSEMSTAQRRAYNTLKSRYRNQIMANIEEYGISKSQMFILKGLTELRLAANHPAMVQEDYTGDSGKQEDIWHALDNAIQEGHKVLVFSQFVRHLQILRLRLNREGLEYAYLAGNTRFRQQEIERFNENPEVQIFLISLKAGGVGLNLASADYVFLLDPWWNPAVEQQAISRAHRIGQSKKVMAYKFIARNTIEEKILRLQDRKKALFDEFIEHNRAQKLTEADIRDLLT